MVTKKKKKTIYNPVTKKRYSVRQRTTKSGRKGQIKGKATTKTTKKKRRSWWW